VLLGKTTVPSSRTLQVPPCHPDRNKNSGGKQYSNRQMVWIGQKMPQFISVVQGMTGMGLQRSTCIRNPYNKKGYSLKYVPVHLFQFLP
jgi:hypothetical protein